MGLHLENGLLVQPVRMALGRAVQSRPVMAAGVITRECVGRKSI
jgi:hypothetical protein